MFETIHCGMWPFIGFDGEWSAGWNSNEKIFFDSMMVPTERSINWI